MLLWLLVVVVVCLFYGLFDVCFFLGAGRQQQRESQTCRPNTCIYSMCIRLKFLAVVVTVLVFVVVVDVDVVVLVVAVVVYVVFVVVVVVIVVVVGCLL